MPNNRGTGEHGGRFIAGLERWERPFAAGDVRAMRAVRSGTVAALFREGLENWERPMRHAAVQEVILSPDQNAAALIRPVSLQVRGTIEVIAGRVAGVWAGLPVLVEKVGAGLVRAGRLDARGRVDFTEVAPGEYRLIASPVSGFLGTYGMVLEGEPKTHRDAPAIAVADQDFSAHGLHGSVRLQPHGEIALRFATEDPSLAGSIVRFAFAEPETGRVQLSGVVELEAEPGQLAQWAGHWQYDLAIAKDCELLFSVERK